MTTPMPRLNGPGSNGPRPGPPLPGQHLPGAQGRPEPADPERIRAEIDGLLAELDARPAWTGLAAPPPTGSDSGADITRRARILEQAHEVLVQALATVDKI
ncbi:hypothetical protein [Nocardia vinacea]|uniref:hypothetical protein n=1 Tax=Nocardia vinacea TaxID=96468 RepID=UPI001FE06119|nr:hypothetical protein [Nocardia vinacea]